jgi:hypothetical protein
LLAANTTARIANNINFMSDNVCIYLSIRVTDYFISRCSRRLRLHSQGGTESSSDHRPIR